MKKRDLFGLLAGLQAVGNLRGVKFVYAVARNARLLQAETKALQAAAQPDEALQALERARIALCTEYAEKDEAGNARVSGASFVIDASKRAQFDDQVAALQGEHAEVVSRREEQLREYEALLDEEADIQLHRVTEEHLPQDITAAQLTAILDMVDAP